MNCCKVLEYIRDKEVIDFLQKLIKIPSVYDPGKPGMNEEEVALFVADYLKKMDFEVVVEEVSPGRPNVIAVIEGHKPGKTILLEAHTDVVTPGNTLEWKHHPFRAEIENGRIYGRGACDTKGNLAAAVMAVKAIKESVTQFKGKIMLCFPVDEEGMMTGIKHFIKRGWADDVDGAIICEPEENQLCIFQKGALRAVVTSRGKMAHGAMPLSGINPNTRMARFINMLEEYEAQEMKRLGKHEYLGYPSFTPTILKAPVEGEAQINVIPSKCITTLDIRTVPGQDHEQIKKDIDNIIREIHEKDPDAKLEIEYIEERPWTQTPKDHPIVKAMAKSYKILTGKEPKYNGVPGATDGTFLRCLKNIPVVVTGAGKREVPHQKDEWVSIDELLETARLYALSILEFLNN